MADMRTKRSEAYERQNLRNIAEKVAARHGLKITGDTSRLNNIPFDRKTQNDVNDLSFLHKTAKEYGFIFSVRGEQLVFLDPSELEKVDAILSFKRENISNYSFRDKTADTFQTAEVSRRDVTTSTVQKWRIETSGDPTKKDALIVGGRVENEAQAEAKAGGAMRQANKDKLTGSFSTMGNPLLVSGVNVEMLEFGAFSGKWTVKDSSHKISSDGGYTTTVSLRKGPYPKTTQPVRSAATSKTAVSR